MRTSPKLVTALALLAGTVSFAAAGPASARRYSYCATTGTNPHATSLQSYGGVSCEDALRLLNASVAIAQHTRGYNARHPHRVLGYSCVVEKVHGKLAGGDCTPPHGDSRGLSWTY